MFDIIKAAKSNAHPEAEDLYERLGVKKDATQAQIRKAYRRAAQEWHPDRHGNSEASKEQFQRIQRAYDVLSDVLQRDFYDATGMKKPNDSEMRATAQDVAMQAFAAHIEAGPKADNMDLETFECVNIVENVAKQLQAAANGLRNQAAAHQRALSKLESMLRRFRKAKGSFEDSPVSVMIRQKIDATKRAKVQDELNADVHEMAIEFAKEYSYDVAQPKPVKHTIVTQGPSAKFQFGNMLTEEDLKRMGMFGHR